jgi:hypothetical protein
MDEQTLKRATEPFFTTKGIGKGTGLGLPMVHRLMAQSGGAMQIVSRVGQGTVVRLWIPADREGVIFRDTAPEVRAHAQRSGRILVIDDDPLILSSTAALKFVIGRRRPPAVVERLLRRKLRWQVPDLRWDTGQGNRNTLSC